MPGRKTKSWERRENRWSMQATMHEKVSQALENNGLSFGFHDVDDPQDSLEQYDTNIMGRFVCRNNACSSPGWSSKKISITIRQYPGNRYNARVYHQHCQSCNRISRPVLDDSYVDRVVYRLKKWSGVQVSPPSFSGNSKGPHQSDLCEGCKAGHCTM